MARFSRMETLNTMKKIGIIPVFYNQDIEILKNIVKACAGGGALVVEMTNRGDHAVEIFSVLEKYCKEEIPKLILGVGSVVDAPTAAMYIARGANFVVSPVIDEETAILCNKYKIPYSPGCGSLTEIQKANSLGVEFCKIFPGAQVGGPEFVKAIMGPCPWTSIMPTGGVDITEKSLSEWFNSGVACVGIGSKLITKEIINSGNFNKLSSNVQKVIEIIDKIREGKD